MNERVKILRQRSLDAEPTIAIERALIVTDAYKEFNGKVSIPMMRALTFKALMENKEICINEGELIVGERGPKPKATPTYPELCCHTIEDFEIIDKREKTYFRVSKEALASHRDVVIPYWEGKSIRDLLLSNMTQEWLDCYYSGLFTEFMEQRAPGHTVADDKIYKRGMLECIQDIDEQLKLLDFNNDADVFDKQEELKAMRICAEAIITYSKRHADKAMQLAEKEFDAKRKAELLSIVEVCSHIPGNAPRSFWEALQIYWFMHLGVITELNTWDAFCPGRLDQHLYPFYKKEIEAGTLTEERATELLELFWIKFNNQPAPPKVGVTLAESGTYTDFANINNGGLKIDGSDGVNDVTYLILKVIDDMRLLQPSSNIQLSKKNPDRFLKNAARIIAKGWGQPSIFNADTVIEELIRQGKSIEDARCGGTSGCVEAGAFGKEAYILTGYFNLVKVMEITLNNGIDPKTGKQLGIKTGDPRQFRGYEDLLEAYKKQVHHFIEIKVRGNAIIETLYAKYMPSPFLSILIDDCIKKGKDYNAGGARYNSNYIQGVGIGTLADSFAAIKLHVFENRTMTMEELLKALNNNFEGNERTRQLMLNKTPKYGNDDEYADDIMKELFDIYYNEVNGRKTVKGGTYRIDMLPTTCHVYFGSVTGATPDGRKSGMPQSEGISPVQGSDINGPTGVIKSAAKMDHLKTGGTLLNLKFTPGLVQNEDGIDKLAHLVRSYFKLDGHHIQFNVVDAETLRKAQMNPEQYKDLIVRVAGYSDYFCDLSGALQNEIIARTEHKEF
jgi:trans-4-hydroxy-L-proline dehydratase